MLRPLHAVFGKDFSVRYQVPVGRDDLEIGRAGHQRYSQHGEYQRNGANGVAKRQHGPQPLHGRVVGNP